MLHSPPTKVQNLKEHRYIFGNHAVLQCRSKYTQSREADNSCIQILCMLQQTHFALTVYKGREHGNTRCRTAPQKSLHTA